MTLLAIAVAWLLSSIGHLLGAPLWLTFPLAVCGTAVIPARGRRARTLHLVAGVLTALAAAMALQPGATAPPGDSVANLAGQRVRLLARLDSEPDPHPNFVAANAVALASASGGVWVPASGRLRLILPPTAEVETGAEVSLFGTVEAGSQSGSAGFSSWLDRQGIVATLAFPAVFPVAPAQHNAVVSAWSGLRTSLTDGLHSVLPLNEALLGSALLFGGRHALPAGVAHDLQVSGLSHLTNVSSFKLVLLFSTLTAFLGPLIGRRHAATAGCLAATGYGLLAGTSVSALRGEVLVLFAALALLSGRPLERVRLLLLAAALLSLPSATILTDPSFQLSFVAAAGALLLTRPLSQAARQALSRNDADDPLGALGSAALDSLCLSAAVSLACLPLLVITFGSLPIYSLAANTLASPLLPVAAALALVAGAAGAHFGPVAPLVAAPAWLALRAIGGLAHIAASLPGNTVSIALPNPWVALLWYLALLLLRPAGTLLRLVRSTPARMTGTPTRRRPSLHRPAPLGARAAATGGVLLAAITVAGILHDAGRSGQAAEVRWLGGAQPMLLVRGSNGALVLVAAGGSPTGSAGALQRALGAGGSASVVVSTRVPFDEQSLLALAGQAQAVRAREVLFPDPDDRFVRELSRNGVVLQPVPHAARLKLGEGEALELIAIHGEDAVARISLAGTTLLVPSGRSTTISLEAWDNPTEADVVALLRGADVNDIELLRGLHPQVVVAARRAGEALSLAEITQPARAVNVQSVESIALRLRGGRPALSFRDRR